jgi:dTDP-4-amino-4,6-dideoxygalactose transaminase
MNKKNIYDLAIFGGEVTFSKPISTSNLVKPSIQNFLEYSKIFYQEQRFTNDGPLVKLLETRLAKFHGSMYCITFANGFWSLVSSIKLLALPNRSEVLMPSLTYRRLADVVAWAGLTPKFCEINEETLSIDLKSVENGISSKTALILGAHPIINTCDVIGLCELSRQNKIPILFDSVESVYETVNNLKVGSFGDAECFSLHASKLINGFEGGYVTTNDHNLANQLRIFRGFGFYGQDNIVSFGINSKLNEIHAAMALASFDDLENQVLRNKKKYRQYQNLLADIKGLKLKKFNETDKSSFKNILVEIDNNWPLERDETIKILNAEGALVRSYYHPALHTRKFNFPVISGKLPITEKLSKNHMLFPCGDQVSDDQIETFVQLLNFIQMFSNEIKLELECLK